MQLDADEDGEPFFKPPAVAPAPLRPSDSEDEEHHQGQKSGMSESREEGENEHGATAIATAEQDE